MYCISVCTYTYTYMYIENERQRERERERARACLCCVGMETFGRTSFPPGKLHSSSTSYVSFVVHDPPIYK